MQVSWISGWGIVPSAMRPLSECFPAGVTHQFFVPSVDAPAQCASSDLLVGWSLGALRILDAAAEGVEFRGKVWLLAPFLDFCSEHGSGGLCSLTQLKWLSRWLARDSHAALSDFYQRAGLDPLPASAPYPVEEMLAGLDRLMQPASDNLRRFASRGLPPAWSAVVGDRDPLLDPAKVCQVLPGCRRVPTANHRADGLFRALTEADRAL